jgi:hypothetical protein
MTPWPPAEPATSTTRAALARPEPANLADVLERVLDKGIVIAGDIRVDLAKIELLTIRLRLLVASVDRAREMGIDWWEHDPMLSSQVRDRRERQVENGTGEHRAGEHRAGEDATGEHRAGEDATGEHRAGEDGASGDG